jgi:uncharacterized protein (TIGR02186 family)
MIGATFSGARVSVSGAIPAGSEVMVMVTGRREDLILKKKGRALGILWMNLGNVTFHHVPTLYLLHVSKVIKEFARSNPVQWQQLGVDLDSLKAQIEVTANTADKDTLRQNFLKMKEDEGLYAMRDMAIRYGMTENRMRSFETDIFIPSRVPPGDYSVKVLALKEGRIIAVAKKNINVKEVGVPAFLYSFSLKHGSLYGILAVLMAIGAGLLMDFLFGEQKGAH